MVLVMAEEFKRINSLRKSSLVASQDKDYQNFIKESENKGQISFTTTNPHSFSLTTWLVKKENEATLKNFKIKYDIMRAKIKSKVSNELSSFR